MLTTIEVTQTFEEFKAAQIAERARIFGITDLLTITLDEDCEQRAYKIECELQGIEKEDKHQMKPTMTQVIEKCRTHFEALNHGNSTIYNTPCGILEVSRCQFTGETRSMWRIPVAFDSVHEEIERVKQERIEAAEKSLGGMFNVKK